MTLGTLDLATLNALLAQALDLPAEQRDAWLGALDAQHTHLRPLLQKLLARADSPEIENLFRTLPKLDAGVGVFDTERAGGERVGPYRLLQVLGRGGMGTVWLAERVDDAPSRRVALKLPLIASQPQMRERLLHERDVLAALEHPGIARLYDAGIDATGQPYLALEYIDGQPIDAYCRERGLDIKSRVRVFVQVARAVAYAHTRLILHRDLKPTNILVTADGRPHLLDFGVAKLLEDGGTRETALTRLAGHALTPDYASPEQILGVPLTVASDVYSLSVVLFELLAGRRPYKLRHDSRGALEDAIVAIDPPLPSSVVSERSVRRQLEGDLDTILVKALKKQPADRYVTVDALVEDLERLLSGRPVLARADSAWYRARKFVARNALAVGAAASVTLALAIGAGVATWQANVARAEARHAQEINRFVLSLFDSANPYAGAPSELRAVDLLKQARTRIESDFAVRPDQQVELLTTVGKSLYALAAHEDAQATLQRALDLAVAQPGAPSTAAQEAAINLIDLLVIRGEYATAERLLDQWETVLRKQPPSVQLAHLLDDRALLLANTSRTKEAVPFAQEALDLTRKVPGISPLDLANITDGLARAQYQADQNDAALSSARQALALYESAGQEARAPAVRVRALIARILRDLDRIDEAATTLGAELPRLREAFGAHSQEYAVNVAEFAQIQDRRGDLASAAESIHEALLAAQDYTTSARSLYFWERLSGEIAVQQRDLPVAREHLLRSLEHAATWRSSNSALISSMLLWQAQVLDRELAPMPAVLRPLADDPKKGAADTKVPPFLVTGVLCTAGHKALAEGRPAEALAYFESAASMFDSVARRNFQFLVPWCLNGQAHALMATGALDAAEAALTQAMQQHQGKSVQPSPLRAETLIERAQLQLRRRHNENALDDAREADAFWKGYRPQSPLAGEAAVWLGRALIAHGDDPAGQREMRRGEAILAAQPPSAVQSANLKK